MEMVTPANIRGYYSFLNNAIKQRVKVEEQREAEKLPVEREDIFHYLCAATDPETGKKALREENLVAEANLLVIAGSDTSANAICGLLFFLAHNPRVYAKLVREITTTFATPDDIVYGPKLMNCTYLRACIDESLRIAPAGPSELPRIVRRGGITINGEFFPEGTIVGMPHWSLFRNEELFGDAYSFRPERWIISDDLDTLNTEADVQRLRDNYHPFSKGVGSCLGKGIAILQVSLAIARTLWRLELQAVPGQTLGQGSRSLGWGRHDPRHYQMDDAFISLRKGPILQFRKRNSGV